MKRCHRMPFGAEILADGRVRFRLWAPSAERVDLCLEKAQEPLGMAALDRGWFEIITDRAENSSDYRFRIDGDIKVPDPASRYNPHDVHGPSRVLDPRSFDWRDDDWHGRPWEEAVLYELHVGTFTPQGTFKGVKERLDYLVDLGVTAIELMPLAAFPGRRNWGYDGVLPYAPHASYGHPDDLKDLIRTAHGKGLMVLLDVVYNHFGPDGNYLHLYARAFFTERPHTAWGAGINFDGTGSRTVRDFFIHNALYWLEEYHFDGLRFDAIHAIADDSAPDIVTELATAIRKRLTDRPHVHLVLENDNNAASYLAREQPGTPRLHTAQWNDDIHHIFHLLITGERDGYYADYADRPLWRLGRCLAEGFAYQGDRSTYRHGEVRGETSRHLPPAAFVSFLQNHDQIGNRGFGERISRLSPPPALRAAVAILLLAPQPPLLFMGEEWAAATPFLYFCDFQGDLAMAVTEGRRREFSRFEKFNDPEARQQIPDPNDPSTFGRSVLDWDESARTLHAAQLAFYRRLLAIRRRDLVPRCKRMAGGAGFEVIDDRGLRVSWRLDEGSRLTLMANLTATPLGGITLPRGKLLVVLPEPRSTEPGDGTLPPWSVYWILEHNA